jgi:hypothetical protein
MPFQSFLAKKAISAPAVDFPYHPSTYPVVLFAIFHYPHEFVSGDSGEIHIFLRNFLIGVADAGDFHFNQNFARNWSRLGDFSQGEVFIEI